MPRDPSAASGPFRSSQIAEGDPYELSNGHRIHCMTAGGRHGSAHGAGSRVLGTDPAVADQSAIDVGITFNEGKNLRAPDIIVGAVDRVPGWQTTFPPLAVEYADGGQDEPELQQKIRELLAGGTQLIWVVRLVGPLRVEVYSPGKSMRIHDADDELTAPGILHNPVPVRALVDSSAANVAALRNLLTPYGYKSIEEIEARKLAEGRAEGRTEGLAAAVLDVLAARGLVPDDERVALIRTCNDTTLLQRWLTRAAVADSLAAVFD
jgi:hypothetical protein